MALACCSCAVERYKSTYQRPDGSGGTVDYFSSVNRGVITQENVGASGGLGSGFTSNAGGTRTINTAEAQQASVVTFPDGGSISGPVDAAASKREDWHGIWKIVLVDGLRRVWGSLVNEAGKTIRDTQ